jgi:hypothetical protein
MDIDMYSKRKCIGQYVYMQGQEIAYTSEEEEACGRCADKMGCQCVRVIVHKGRYWLCMVPRLGWEGLEVDNPRCRVKMSK